MKCIVFSMSKKKKKHVGTLHTQCWSHLVLVTCTEGTAVIESLHSPPPPPPPLVLLLTLYMQRGGEEGVWRGRGRLCLCVGGHGVSGGGEGGCLFEDSARLPRLASPAWLFEAVRWPHRATSLQVGGWGGRGGGWRGCVCVSVCVTGAGGGGVWKTVICIQLFLSSRPAPLLLLLLLLPLVYRFL